MTNPHTSFYTQSGTEYFWPSIPDWNIVFWHNTDIFGSAWGVSYQHDQVIVEFDGSGLVSNCVGTWRFNFYDVETKGVFSNLEEISDILNNVLTMLPSIENKALEALPNIEGWYTEHDCGVANYYIEFSADICGVCTFMDVGDFLNGETVFCQFCILDNGGYVTNEIFQRDLYINKNNLERTMGAFVLIGKEVVS